jgi:hypothetical protein
VESFSRKQSPNSLFHHNAARFPQFDSLLTLCDCWVVDIYQ